MQLLLEACAAFASCRISLERLTLRPNLDGAAKVHPDPDCQEVHRSRNKYNIIQQISDEHHKLHFAAFHIISKRISTIVKLSTITGQILEPFHHSSTQYIVFTPLRGRYARTSANTRSTCPCQLVQPMCCGDGNSMEII